MQNKKLKELEEKINKFLELKDFLSSNTQNLKLYYAASLTQEDIKEELEKRFRINLKFLNSFEFSDDLFYVFCEDEFQNFKEFLQENYIDFDNFVRIGRTSSFYCLNKDLYDLDYRHNNLVRYLYDLDREILEGENFKFQFSDLRFFIENYNLVDLDLFLDEVDNLIENYQEYKKAYEYIENFTENQIQLYIEYIYYNIVEQEEAYFLEELKESYDKKVKKAINKKRKIS